MRIVSAVLAALVTGAIGWLALRIGFDPVGQGGPLLAARLFVDGTGSFAGSSTPLADALLGGWLAVTGASVASLVRLDAMALAVIAGSGAWWWHARGGPIAVVTWVLVLLGAAPLPSAVALASLTTLVWWWSPSRTRPIVIGAGWIFVAALDPRVAIGLGPLAAWALGSEHDARRRAGIGAAAAFLALSGAGIAVLGFEVAWTRGIAAPIDDLVGRLTSGESVRFVRTAIGGMLLTEPFGSWPPTGASTWNAWAGQGAMRATALRVVVLATLIGSVWSSWWWSTRRDRRSALALSFFVCALAWLLLRGDVMGLRQALVPLSAAGLTIAHGPSRRAGTIATALVLLALPLTAEAVTRAITAGPATLVRWNDERGGVLVEERRSGRWNAIRRQIVPRGGEPALIWPTDPGAHWILGTTPLIPDSDLPSGPDDDRRIRAALQDRPPRLVMLGPDQRLLGHRLLASLPRTWELLRDRYRLAGMVRFERDDLRLLMPFDGGAQDPLARMLPAVELTVANERTPALRAGFQVGQSFRLGPRDLQGFAVRVRTRATDLAVDFRIQVWQERGSGFDAALLSERVSTTIAGDGAVAWFRTPLPDTAGRDLAITLELRSETVEEIRLDWYVHDEAHEPDFYPEGTALIGMDPAAADLYFLVY